MDITRVSEECQTKDEAYLEGYIQCVDDMREMLMDSGFIVTQHALEVFDTMANYMKEGANNGYYKRITRMSE